jgi:glycerol uptake facilitator-like aquaporin
LGGQLPGREAVAFAGVQCVAAIGGVLLAHLMFGEPAIQTSHHVRAGAAQWLSEVVATFGLIGVIQATARHRPAFVPIAVGAYITGAYWFTASTSFANPAVTIARTLTDTFSGIRPQDAPGFIAAQLVGAIAATYCWSWLLGPGDPADRTTRIAPNGK